MTPADMFHLVLGCSVGSLLGATFGVLIGKRFWQAKVKTIVEIDVVRWLAPKIADHPTADPVGFRDTAQTVVTPKAPPPKPTRARKPRKRA